MKKQILTSQMTHHKVGKWLFQIKLITQKHSFGTSLHKYASIRKVILAFSKSYKANAC